MLNDGTFYWEASPGFLGEYELLFEGPDAAPTHVRVEIHERNYLPAQPQ
jgi:hypothetical protein